MSVQLFDYTYLVMKQTMRTALSLVMTLLYVAILCGAFLLFTYDAYAQVGIPAAGVELTGYAWSDNIGWISMNCRTGGSAGESVCPGSPGIGQKSDYKVTVTTGGALTGYAWSSNIGWIKFDLLNSFPVMAGTMPASARVTGTYPNLTFEGWARACAGTLPGDCSSMTSRTDGWDGWISLRSTAASNYSIIMTDDVTGALYGSYAWGSEVVGWIDFDQIAFRLARATLSGTNCTIALGASTCNSSLTWIITDAASPNVRNTTRSLTYASVAAGTNALHPITFGSNTIQARNSAMVIKPPGDVTVTGFCPEGTDFNNGTTCETKAPAITISTSRTIVRSGETVLVSWTTTPSPVASGSCAITGPGMPSSVTGSEDQTSSALRSKTRFNITCTGPYGSVSTSTQVELIPVAKEV